MKNLKVYSIENHNLHSASTPGGLIHVPARRPSIVPIDVKDHPAFDLLVRSGHIRVLKSYEEASLALPVKIEPKQEKAVSDKVEPSDVDADEETEEVELEEEEEEDEEQEK